MASSGMAAMRSSCRCLSSRLSFIKFPFRRGRLAGRNDANLSTHFLRCGMNHNDHAEILQSAYCLVSQLADVQPIFLRDTERSRNTSLASPNPKPCLRRLIRFLRSSQQNSIPLLSEYGAGSIVSIYNCTYVTVLMPVPAGSWTPTNTARHFTLVPSSGRVNSGNPIHRRPRFRLAIYAAHRAPYPRAKRLLCRPPLHRITCGSSKTQPCRHHPLRRPMLGLRRRRAARR